MKETRRGIRKKKRKKDRENKQIIGGKEKGKPKRNDTRRKEGEEIRKVNKGQKESEKRKKEGNNKQKKEGINET